MPLLWLFEPKTETCTMTFYKTETCIVSGVGHLIYTMTVTFPKYYFCIMIHILFIISCDWKSKTETCIGKSLFGLWHFSKTETCTAWRNQQAVKCIRIYSFKKDAMDKWRSQRCKQRLRWLLWSLLRSLSGVTLIAQRFGTNQLTTWD